MMSQTTRINIIRQAAKYNTITDDVLICNLGRREIVKLKVNFHESVSHAKSAYTQKVSLTPISNVSRQISCSVYYIL